MIFFKNIILFILIIQTIGCTSDNSNTDDFEVVEFSIKTDLVSTNPVMVNDIFELRVPIKYEKLDETKFLTTKNIIESDSSAFLELSLQSVFKSQNNQYLLISKIISDNNVFNDLDSTYYELLIENFETTNINIGKIKINGIKVIQYLITTKSSVVIKLILQFDDSYYQIDYIIPLEIYENELKGIESSIGSIHEIKKDKK